MDYLLRDSYHVGVDYGRFDLERTIESLTICLAPIARAEDSPTKELTLAIERDDWLAAESVVLARRAMFRQVYLHKTRRVFDLMLILAMRRVLPGGQFPSLEHLDDYLKLTDFSILSQVSGYAGNMLLKEALHSRSFPRRAGSLDGDEPAQLLGLLRQRPEMNGIQIFTDTELMNQTDLDALEAPESVWVDTGATFKTYKSDPRHEIRLRDSQNSNGDINTRLTGTRLSTMATGLSLEEALQMSSYRIYCSEPNRQRVTEAVIGCGGKP